ncbi:phosphotransferase family protein [Streptomyces sp. NPDC059690]|uniref:phosphotransferase family protein n=1 Tax=Streptomyces sp. NPDC059690 TaxID=3346907 RepID=UPI00369DCD84
MTSASLPDSPSRIAELSVDGTVVRDTFTGYHHVTRVLRYEDRIWVKCREPRAQILWFDRRCFTSEEELLLNLRELGIERVPDVVTIDRTHFQGFIEGRTLGVRQWWQNRRVPEVFTDQLLEIFRQLVQIRPEMLTAQRRCTTEDRSDDYDTEGFLERLIVFMERQVYTPNLPLFHELFGALGIGEESFTRLRKSVYGLKRRPFSLLHADLHRENLIVDPQGRIWVIDWELAMVGDPLYDLATHLYLMKFPELQERRMAQEWSRVVERARRGSSHGWEDDLPRILAFKKGQSVFTDVIRVSLQLDRRGDLDWAGLPFAAARLHSILLAAAGPIGLEAVPNRSQIAKALVRWHRTAELGKRPTVDVASSAS